MMKKESKNFAIGVAIAAGIGYLAGVLTAPKSGKETRDDIKRGAVQAKIKLEATLKKLYSEAGAVIAENKAKLATLSGKTKAELNAAIKKAQAAKDKAKVVLTAIHEGEAEDAELDKAVKELKSAISGLKNFADK